ncbi:hypothetical protein ACHAWF_002438 [Thalassiosira exigua]
MTMRVPYRRCLWLLSMGMLASLFQTFYHLHKHTHLTIQEDSGSTGFLRPPRRKTEMMGRRGVLAKETVPPRAIVPGCNDTATYYDLNAQEWGVRSKVHPPPTADAALNASDAVWLVANWISLKQPSKRIMESIKEKRSHPITSNKTIKLLITDSNDRGSKFYGGNYELNRCLHMAANLLGPNNVHLASRALVVNRDLSCFSTKCNQTTHFGGLNGTVLDYRQGVWEISTIVHNGVVAKWDFALRNDYGALFDERVRLKLGFPANASVSSSDYFQYPRTADVAHLWDEEPMDRYSALRNRVTATVRELIATYNLTGIAGLVSSRGKVGRSRTSSAYADALLDHKIIVVAQRDHWEDHVRLFESLGGGAMVLSDPITHPPAGFVDGRSIVFYTSLDDLSRKILYYLIDEKGRRERVRIARAGRELVSEHHRPHHRHERLMLGNNWPTTITNPVAPLIKCG